MELCRVFELRQSTRKYKAEQITDEQLHCLRSGRWFNEKYHKNNNEMAELKEMADVSMYLL